MNKRPRNSLEARSLTYVPPGRTTPSSDSWSAPDGSRAYELTVRIGAGEQFWQDSSTTVLSWGVKTRSGFSVEAHEPAEPLRVRQRYWLAAHLGPVTIREPVEVVALVADDRRAGFAYGTLAGHPVSGEEAFIVHRDELDQVWLTLRSLTRPGYGWWRILFPLVLIAQRVYRRRYRRALVQR